MEPTPARTRYQPILIGVAAVIAGSVVVGALAIRNVTPSGRGDEEGVNAVAAPRADGRVVTRACANCGVVESVRAVEVRTDIGADGHPGRSNADVRVVDGQPVAKRTTYRVTVRMDDGSYRTLSQVALPAVAVGDPVRIVDGAVVPRKRD